MPTPFSGPSPVDPGSIRINKPGACANMRSRAAAAACWFEFGFSIIPIRPGEKKSAVRWDPWLDSLDLAHIQAHWDEYPDHDLGLIVGDAFIVFDADTPQSVEALKRIEAEHGIEPTLIVETRRGVHHYFRRAPGTIARSDAHSTADFPERIDVKTGRALVVLPPSTGKRVLYQDARTSADLTVADQSFIDAVFRHNGREAPRDRHVIKRQVTQVASSELPMLAALLEHLDPDCGYDDWLHVLMAIHYETGGSEAGLALADCWSSRGGKYCGERELAAKWRSFDNHTGTPITSATLHQMLGAQGIDWMSVCAAAEGDFEDLDMEILEPPRVSAPDIALARYSLQGLAGELEKQTASQRFLLDPLVLLGDWTVFYAAPNTGKTLVTLSLLAEAIHDQRIDPGRVFYVNVDDNLSGLTQKLRIADELGFHMIAEGHRGFKASELRDALSAMIRDDSAKDVVVILDTLKKFTDLMDKKVATAFGRLLRRFVMKGGTVIALAHTNKNRGRDGKRVYGGTSDIVDDADCAFIMDAMDAQDRSARYVTFENIKRRGDNALTAHFAYTLDPVPYDQRLASVRRVEEADLLLPASAHDVPDSAVIAAIHEAIASGTNTKMRLAADAATRAGVSKRTALRVLEDHTGNDPGRHEWQFEVRERGAKVYLSLARPAPPGD